MKVVSSLIYGFSVTFCLLLPASAQDFVLEQRQIRVEHDALYELLGDDLYGESDTEIARRLFSMPIEEFLQSDGRDVEVTSSIVYFKGNFVRMGDDTQYSIVNMETGTVQYVNAQERSYMEWTQEDSRDMEAQLEAQMEASGYSAEDLERMRQEIMEEAGVSEEDMDEYEEEYGEEYGDDDDDGEAIGNGKTAEINGRSATSHESRDYGVVTVTWCSPDDTALFERFKTMAESSALQMMDEEDGGQDDVICEDGLPVREQTYHSVEKFYMIDDMLSVSEESLSDELFRVPAEFTKQEMPF